MRTSRGVGRGVLIIIPLADSTIGTFTAEVTFQLSINSVKTFNWLFIHESESIIIIFVMRSSRIVWVYGHMYERGLSKWSLWRSYRVAFCSFIPTGKNVSLYRELADPTDVLCCVNLLFFSLEPFPANKKEWVKSIQPFTCDAHTYSFFYLSETDKYVIWRIILISAIQENWAYHSCVLMSFLESLPDAFLVVVCRVNVTKLSLVVTQLYFWKYKYQ